MPAKCSESSYYFDLASKRLSLLVAVLNKNMSEGSLKNNATRHKFGIVAAIAIFKTNAIYLLPIATKLVRYPVSMHITQASNIFIAKSR